MKKQPRIFDDKMSVKRGFGRIMSRKISSGETYLDGEVVTPNGIVTIYTQGGQGNYEFTRLDISHRGIYHMRNISKRYSPQYIVTLATRFAKEICR